MIIFNKRLLYSQVRVDKSDIPPIEEEPMRFEIIPVPSTATVIINGETRTIYEDLPGTPITWSVSASGYITQSGETEMDLVDTVLRITLKAASTTNTLALSSAVQNETSSQYGIQYRFITLKNAFVAKHNYKITYTQSTNCSFGGATMHTTNQSSTNLINGKSIDPVVNGGGISDNASTTIPSGTYTRTFTATANANYLHIQLSLMGSAPNLSGNIVIVDNP